MGRLTAEFDEVIRKLLQADPDQTGEIKLGPSVGMLVASELEATVRLACFHYDVVLHLEKSGFWIKQFLITMKGKPRDLAKVLLILQDFTERFEESKS